jgi:hypothetical protein
MSRKVLLIAIAIVILLTGIMWFRAGHGTPEAAAKAFTNNLAQGKTDIAYAQLSTDLTKGRESYWRDFLKQFSNQKSGPTFGKEDQVVDSFNTYTKAEDPHRFTYTFHLKDKDYQLIVLLVKQGNSWKVDELTGAAIK